MLNTANEVISAMQMLENAEQRKVLMGFFKTGKGQYDVNIGFFAQELINLAKH